MLKIKSNISRAERKENVSCDENALHVVWYRRICDIMEKDKCDPWSALDGLKKEVSLDITGYAPQVRGQVEQAWRNFLNKIKHASSASQHRVNPKN